MVHLEVFCTEKPEFFCQTETYLKLAKALLLLGENNVVRVFSVSPKVIRNHIV